MEVNSGSIFHLKSLALIKLLSQLAAPLQHAYLHRSTCQNNWREKAHPLDPVTEHWLNGLICLTADKQNYQNDVFIISLFQGRGEGCRGACRGEGGVEHRGVLTPCASDPLCSAEASSSLCNRQAIVWGLCRGGSRRSVEIGFIRQWCVAADSTSVLQGRFPSSPRLAPLRLSVKWDRMNEAICFAAPPHVSSLKCLHAGESLSGDRSSSLFWKQNLLFQPFKESLRECLSAA